MRRLITICLLALSATALLVTAPAASGAKKKAAKKPQITRVMPMRISVGKTLTIRGKNFSPKRRRNTVVFRGPSGRSAFVKPRRASRTKLVVVVPHAVGRLLRGDSADPRPTRLKLRVLTGRVFSKFTTRRLSPVVTGFGEGDGPGKGGNVKPPCTDRDDHDGDLLSNSLEGQLGTDRCKADTDGDGVEDGYEYKSAIDLNDDEFQNPNATLPYPGKRPYPNALDPSDAGKDFDGDVLTLTEEQVLWRYTGVRTLFDLTYSDGEQYSIRARDGNNRRVPALTTGGYAKHADFLAWTAAAGYRHVMLSDGAPWWNHGTTRHSYGLLDFNRDGSESSTTQAGYARPETTYFDFDQNGYLSDNERDEDADGLTNYDESHGRGTASYWKSCYTGEAAHPIEFAGTGVDDPDSDGDGVRDGADDQDHDDVPNVMELSRLAASGLDDTAGITCKVDPELDVGNFAAAGGPLPNSTVLVAFTGEFSRTDVPEMVATGSFTGGSAPTVSVTTIRDGSPTVNELQAVTINGAPEGGNFTLTLGSETTTAIAFNATADAVEEALEAVFPTAANSNHPNVYGRVNPFNPCLPARWSPSCSLHPSFENAGAPFDGSVNWYSLN
jgi:hypothetical protein